MNTTATASTDGTANDLDVKPNLKMWIIQFLLGLSSGMPLLLVGSTLSAYLKDRNVSLAAIGIFAMVKMPYSLKFLWSPLMDRFPIPGFTRRKGWMLTTQILLLISIFSMGTIDPATSPWAMATLAFLVAFFSASQDIVSDAYRRETLPTTYIGLGTAYFVSGYRIGMIITGAVSLFLADLMAWNHVFQIMGLLMVIGIGATLVAPEKNLDALAPKTLYESVLLPFIDFFKKPGSLLILLFIVLYKAGDNMASQMNVAYILEHGYTKTEYAAIAKGGGILATIFGLFIGGSLIVKLGIRKSLWIFGILQAVSILFFIPLHNHEKSIQLLTMVMISENIFIGMGTAAFVSYMASLTNVKFTATQYALLSSFSAFSGSFLSAPTGILVQRLGWIGFYQFCTYAAIPGMLILFLLGQWEKRRGGAST